MRFVFGYRTMITAETGAALPNTSGAQKVIHIMFLPGP
jgi:hypothetical protein